MDKLIKRMSRTIEDERPTYLLYSGGLIAETGISQIRLLRWYEGAWHLDLSDSDVRRVMDRFDRDGDGLIDYLNLRNAYGLLSLAGTTLIQIKGAHQTHCDDRHIIFRKAIQARPREDEAIMIEVVSINLKDP